MSQNFEILIREFNSENISVCRWKTLSLIRSSIEATHVIMIHPHVRNIINLLGSLGNKPAKPSSIFYASRGAYPMKYKISNAAFASLISLQPSRAVELSRDEKLRVQTLFFDANFTRSQICLQTGYTYDQVCYAIQHRLTPQKRKHVGRRVLLNTPQRKKLI